MQQEQKLLKFFVNLVVSSDGSAGEFSQYINV